jgi:D-3-phosphoglycerate dehydrogenase
MLGRRPVKEELIDFASGCTGVIAGVEPYDEEVFASLPTLRCISRCGVGIDNIELASAARRGVVIRNTPQVVVQPVAEMTVAMAFDLLRKLSVHSAAVKNGSWRKEPGRLLSKQVVGVVGLGRIGRRVAELMRALGARVLGCDPIPDIEWAAGLDIRLVPLSELLATADIVSLHVAPANGALFRFGGNELSAMKRGALLINVARGQFVDEAALVDALRSGRLGGAALDVFASEPYRGGLCDLENVILTPHIATFTHESRTQMEIEAAENLLQELSRVGRANV